PVQARIVFDVLDQFGEDAEKPGNREGSLTDSKVWNGLLWYNLDYDRTMPMELDMPFESSHRYVIAVPPYFSLENRFRDREVRSKWGTFRLKVKAEGENPRQVEIEYHTRIDKVAVQPEDFEAFHQFHDDVLKYYRVWLTLTPARDNDQAPLLEALLALTPGDAATAALLADLYLFNQQKAAARRVPRGGRMFHPTSAKLGELAIKAAADPKEEEAIYRDLIKHSPRELKYALALGQNLVNQGKYKAARTTLEPVAQKGT